MKITMIFEVSSVSPFPTFSLLFVTGLAHWNEANRLLPKSDHRSKATQAGSGYPVSVQATVFLVALHFRTFKEDVRI